MRAVSGARTFTGLLRLARGLLVAGILLQSAGVRAQGTTGTLRGRVIDESTLQCLAGVTIEIVDAEETTLRASTSTDANGRRQCGQTRQRLYWKHREVAEEVVQ
ncbi:MAG: hypothetical protein GTO22_03920 [Gemmatimonadales bacterium]|nr:hypothetical protein [Gemmatimonadales bacterium]